MHIDVCTGDLVQEGGLADVGVSADEKGTGGRIDGGKTGQMFPNLLQKLERLILPLHDRGHTTESGTLELLASVERIVELEQTDVDLRLGR